MHYIYLIICFGALGQHIAQAAQASSASAPKELRRDESSSASSSSSSSSSSSIPIYFPVLWEIHVNISALDSHTIAPDLAITRTKEKGVSLAIPPTWKDNITLTSVDDIIKSITYKSEGPLPLLPEHIAYLMLIVSGTTKERLDLYELDTYQKLSTPAGARSPITKEEIRGAYPVLLAQFGDAHDQDSYAACALPLEPSDLIRLINSNSAVLHDWTALCRAEYELRKPAPDSRVVLQVLSPVAQKTSVSADELDPFIIANFQLATLYATGKLPGQYGAEAHYNRVITHAQAKHRLYKLIAQIRINTYKLQEPSRLGADAAVFAPIVDTMTTLNKGIKFGIPAEWLPDTKLEHLIPVAPLLMHIAECLDDAHKKTLIERGTYLIHSSRKLFELYKGTDAYKTFGALLKRSLQLLKQQEE